MEGHVPVRRAHKKSRNGCFNCKKRKVKVSEILSLGHVSNNIHVQIDNNLFSSQQHKQHSIPTPKLNHEKDINQLSI